MKKRVFFLFLLLTIVFITMGFSCMAAGPSYSSGGLTIIRDPVTGNPSSYSSSYYDISGGSINYRTTIGSMDAIAFSDAARSAEVGRVENQEVDLGDTSYGTYTGALPTIIRDFLITNKSRYCRVVFHPRVEGYFGGTTNCFLPSNPILSPNSDMRYAPGNQTWAQFFTGYWSLSDTQAGADNRYKSCTGGLVSNYYPGGNASGSIGGVIESYNQKNSVYGSYIGWAGGTDDSTGEYSPFATFDAINSRFTDTYLDVDPPEMPRIAFHNWVEPTTMIDGVNTIPFQYIITSYDVTNTSRTPEYSAVLEQLQSNGEYTHFCNFATSEDPQELYFDPTDATNGRRSTAIVLSKDTPYSASFKIDTTLLNTPGTYKVRISINATSGIETPYDASRHQREFTFTLNSDRTITPGTGLNLAIRDITLSNSTLLPGHIYTATVGYTVTGSFPDGAKISGSHKMSDTAPRMSDTAPSWTPIFSNEFAAGTSFSGTGRSLTAVALTPGVNYNYTFEFTIPVGYTEPKIGLRAEIIPEGGVVESIPYAPDDPWDPNKTDNVREKTFPVNAPPPPPAGNYLNIGIYPATEKLIVFTNQTRVQSYWHPLGNTSFSDVSWSYGGIVVAPTVIIAETGTNGTLTSTLTGTRNLNSDKIDKSNHLGNAETIFGSTAENDTQSLNCQTNTDFGSSSHSHGDDVDEGGCTSMGSGYHK